MWTTGNAAKGICEPWFHKHIGDCDIVECVARTAGLENVKLLERDVLLLSLHSFILHPPRLYVVELLVYFKPIRAFFLYPQYFSFFSGFRRQLCFSLVEGIPAISSICQSAPNNPAHKLNGTEWDPVAWISN